MNEEMGTFEKILFFIVVGGILVAGFGALDTWMYGEYQGSAWETFDGPNMSYKRGEGWGPH